MTSALHRLRFSYPKGERLAFLGHLEVISTIERSIRRAGLPFAVSNGFARRMRVQFSSALPVGASSQAEYFDLYLTQRKEVGEVLELLCRCTPTALRPTRARYIDEPLPALEAWLDRSSWILDLGTQADPADFEAGFERLKREGSFTYMRGTKPKTVDVASSYAGHALEPCEGGLLLALDTRTTALGSMRPEAFVRACFARSGNPGACPDYVRCVRVAQHHFEDGGLVEPI